MLKIYWDFQHLIPFIDFLVVSLTVVDLPLGEDSNSTWK